MKSLIVLASALAAVCARAGLDVSVTSVGQDERRAVVVDYVLFGASAIVTASFETNAVDETTGETVWAPISGENVKSVAGEINRIVSAGAHSFSWKVTKDWRGRTIPAGGIRVKLEAKSVYDPPDYLVVDLEKDEDAVRYYASADGVPGGVGDAAYKTTKLLMRRIHAANVPFRMGGAAYDDKRVLPRERPRMVTLTEDFYIGVYEFTQRQYELVAGFEGSTVANRTPSKSKSVVNAAMRPVTNIQASHLRGATADYSWIRDGHDVSATLPMGLLRGRYGFAFDLPTSAQWEFAARGGTTTPYISGAYAADSDDWGQENSHKMDDYAWSLFKHDDDDGDLYDYSYFDAGQNKVITVDKGSVPHVVGKLKANAFGLYDVFGNVNEICLDWYWTTSNDYDCLADVIDPKGPPTPSTDNNYATQTMAGGSCVTGGQGGNVTYLRSSSRFTWNNALVGNGFRICCPAVAH